MTALLADLPLIMIAIFIGFGGYLIIEDSKKSRKKANKNPR